MTIVLDKKGIYEYQQNREPYLMIDHASEVIPGVSAKGYKDFKNDVSVIKPISKNGALIFFPHLSPQLFNGVDTLKLGSNNNVKDWNKFVENN